MTKHVHHSYIWLSLLQAAFAVFIALVFTAVPILLEEGALEEVFGGTAPRGELIALGIAVLCVVVLGLTALMATLSYRNLSYELGEEEFNLYSGIISKKRVHVPYQRIQSVNQKASLIQRILGVCTVNIDTAGGASNKAITVPYLQNTEAERLRYELFARKQALLSGSAGVQVTSGLASAGYPSAAHSLPPSGAPFGPPILSGQAVAPAHSGLPPQNVLDAPAQIMSDLRGVFGNDALDTGAVTFQYGMTNRELFLTGLSNKTGFVLLVLSAFATLASTGAMLLQSALVEVDYERGLSFAAELVSSPVTAGLIIGGVVAALLVFWLISIGSTCLAYGGFRATRRGSRIEVERGLLQHHFQGVDIDRVQSVIIKQSFVRRIFGYCELSLGKIDALAAESNNQQQTIALGLVVHPFLKLSRVPEILAGLVPEFDGLPTTTRPVAKQALRRALIRRAVLAGGGFWLSVALAAASLCVALFVMPALEAQVATGAWGEARELRGAVELYATVALVLCAALCLLLMVLDVVGAVLWYRGSNYAYNRHFLQVTNGGFSRECVCLPRKKIQYGVTRTNPFQRRAQVKTINARTAAGIGGTTVKLRDVYEAEASEWLDWVKPRT
ncbi:MAG: PH domain-containing protein [Coriobacteriales bacterium]|jgi:putative membrane protein|nr:PH domain-containing protein [Coriobacteriales bacterium]